jgi:hypothetical protein
MDILDLARKSGMTVVLDAKIGREEYYSVHSSISALELFAQMVRASMQAEPAELD